MKAVILAGGEGTRLRPLTVNCPKPLTHLAGRPVMEYILRLLRQQGIREIAVTTAYLADTIEAVFGDGSEFDVHLTYFQETVPRGTAGGMAECAAFLGQEDFLVISGDCICDFDFSPCIALHRQKNAAATLVLYHCPVPLEYGQVCTDAENRVTRFVEKPAWEQVCTDTVNTGIYILSPRIFEKIPPDRPFDFAGDLFPLLLREQTLYALASDGYWCDIGDCAAFLRCHRALLDGTVRAKAFGLDALTANGESFPEASVSPACFIDRDVRILPGAVIDAGTTLENGTSVGEGARVSDSVCMGCVIGDGAEVAGAIVGRGTVIGAHARLEPGCVVGNHCRVGAYATLTAAARLWPEQTVPDGLRVSETLTADRTLCRIVFDSTGHLSGTFSLEDGTALGMALAQSADSGTVALGCTDSPSADAFLSAIAVGLRTCGAAVLRHDAPIEALARFAQILCRSSWGIYITEPPDGGFSVTLYAENGTAPTRKALRKIEGAALRRDVPRIPNTAQIRTEIFTGCRELYLANTGADCNCQGARVTVSGEDPAAALLSELLSRRGAILSPGAYIAWKPSPDGLTLEALDEQGSRRDWSALLAVQARLSSAPHEITETPPDGLTLALQLTAKLAQTHQTLWALASELPKQVTASCDVDLRHERAEVMRRLTEALDGKNTVTRENGSVTATPLADRRALRIAAQSTAAENAEALCDWMERFVRDADR